MFNKKLFIAGILMMFAFAVSTLAQDRVTTKITKTKNPNVQQATNQRPKQNRVPGNNPNARKSGGKRATQRHNHTLPPICWECERRANGGKGTKGKVQFQDFHFSKSRGTSKSQRKGDKASPKLTGRSNQRSDKSTPLLEKSNKWNP